MSQRFDLSRVEALLRLAGEAERVDAGGAVRAGATPSRVREPAWRSVSSWLAIAASAALLVGGSVMWMTRTATLPGVGTVARARLSEPAIAGAPTPSSLDRSSVLLSISEGEQGELQCVRWSPPGWGDRTLEQLTTNELQSAGLSMVCSSNPRRVVVIGMQGPAARLPGSDDVAMAMARCVLSAPACGSKGFDPRLCGTAGCLPGDVQVRVESIAMR